MGRTHLIVIASAEEDVVGGGMPLNEADTPAMPVQLQHRLRHVPLQTALGDLPDPNLQDGDGVRMGLGALGGPDTCPGGSELPNLCSAPMSAASSCILMWQTTPR